MIDVPKIVNGRQIIMLCEFGSQLYGTAGPDSDTDYKGIFMPTKEEVLLGRVPKSINYQSKKGTDKNGSDDVDCEVYSLHYFLKLACDGQTVALDMLHVPEHDALITTPIWSMLHAQRSKFYTKNLSAFIGYCRTQAAKYGIKGSRLDAAEKVIVYLKSILDEAAYYSVAVGPLSDYWDYLPTGEHIHFLPRCEKSKQRMYQVCGKKFQEKAKVDYVYGVLKAFYEHYGERAKLAKENKGIDWKAVSHACRAAVQLHEIYNTGDLKFPLEAAEWLKCVKNGESDYTTVVAPHLEGWMEVVEALAATSHYPEKVDRKYWDRWLVNILEDEYNES